MPVQIYLHHVELNILSLLYFSYHYFGKWCKIVPEVDIGYNLYDVISTTRRTETPFDCDSIWLWFHSVGDVVSHPSTPFRPIAYK